MHFEFLVEEPSTEAALETLLPLILGDAASFSVHPYQGKGDLLNKLPIRLRGYARWLPNDTYIIVLLDEDRQDCHALKAKMERIAHQAGLSTKSAPDSNGRFQVINRIAIEELEAWYFGDVPALRQVYPRLPATLGRQERYRNPDAIVGGTWEALEKLLVRHHYLSKNIGLPKIEVARRITAHMTPAQNRSGSFCLFRDTLQALVAHAR
jgi:hypothetical protein